MGSSDSKGKSGSSSKAATPAASAAPGSTMTIPPFMAPHIQGLLAQQLAQGFGGDPASYISPLFQPMTLPIPAQGGGLLSSGAGAASSGASAPLNRIEQAFASVHPGAMDRIMERRKQGG